MKAKNLLRALIIPAALLASSHGAKAQGSYVNYGLPWVQNMSLGAAIDINHGLYGTTYLGFNLRCNGSNAWVVEGNSFGGGGAALYGDQEGGLHFITIPKNSNASTQNLTTGAVLQQERMVLTRTGTLRIGALMPTAHPDAKLAVNGKAVVHSIYATAPVNWADYVFEKNYQLMPLPELEQYVLANKHLPEVPTTAQVAEAGVNVAEMNVVLLKKVEELTLHLIEANKRIERLEAAQGNQK